MNLIGKRLTENVKTVQQSRVQPEVDVIADLAPRDTDANSWLMTGRFEADGHTLDYIFQVLSLPIPGMGDVYASIVSVTDETTGYYYAEDKIYSAAEVEVAESGLGIRMPNGYLGGDWDKLQIQRETPGVVINIEATAVGNPLYVKGIGRFPLLGTVIHNWDVPYMRTTTGTLMVDGKRYDVTGRGYTWIDRGWQNNNPGADVKVTWMGIWLDNGEAISLFDTNVPGHAECFVMVLHPDGSQDFFPLTKPLDASGFWHSERSGQYYPSHWENRIPQCDAVLDITPVVREQEVVATAPMLHRYQGGSLVTGVWGGREVKGWACTYLLGRWPR